jgi:hypothetical protein
MEEDLIQYMLADSGISALVATRIHWDERPQGGGLPDIVMHNLGGPIDYHMQGPSGLEQTRIQIDCWSNKSKAESLAIKRAVKAALSGLRANLSGVEIQGMFIDAYNDAFDAAAEASEHYYRHRLDFIVWFNSTEIST